MGQAAVCNAEHTVEVAGPDNPLPALLTSMGASPRAERGAAPGAPLPALLTSGAASPKAELGLKPQDGGRGAAARRPPGLLESLAAAGACAWVKEAYLEEVTVLVSDLSGFTRKTREFGIVHFASVIVRKRQLCLPILHRHGVAHVGTEADNLIAVFRDAVSATKAAVEMLLTIAAHNSEIPKERAHFRVPLNGVGIHCAKGLFVDTEGGLHGEAYRTAYHIGEDVADGGRVLITEAVRDRVRADPYFKQAAFNSFAAEDPELSLYTVEGETGPALPAPSHAEGAQFLHPGLLQLARRYDTPAAELEALDAEIRSSCMCARTALMFSLDVEAAGSLCEELAAQHRALEALRPVAKRHSGTVLEDLFWTFTRAADAVAAALDIQATLAELTASEKAAGRPRAALRGCGVHSGQLLFVEGTDVHWGDPANTSSKLGQDLARGGEVLITPQVREATWPEAERLQLRLSARTLHASGVDFACFSVKHSKVSL